VPLDDHGEATGAPGLEATPHRLLELDRLAVHFPIRRGLLRRVVGQVRAVDGVSLSIGRGQTLALVGESGCGKTTVGKAILGLVRATGGMVRFDGDAPARFDRAALRRYRRRVQIVFQDPFGSLDPRMSVGEIVMEGLRAQSIGANDEARLEQAAALLERVGLPAAAIGRYPHEFSGGQRQRLAIARALAVGPDLLVCDEPTSALDVSVQAQILNLLRRLQRELGLACLFITHNLAAVAWIADRVAVMYLGRIVEEGPVADVLARPAHPYTRALLSAAPTLGPKPQRILLPGEMPSPVHPPSGCAFHPRCAEAEAACRAGVPAARWVAPGHAAACLHVTGAEAP
jgi:peptide/nickel transport system ATP-binding protein